MSQHESSLMRIFHSGQSSVYSAVSAFSRMLQLGIHYIYFLLIYYDSRGNKTEKNRKKRNALISGLSRQYAHLLFGLPCTLQVNPKTDETLIHGIKCLNTSSSFGHYQNVNSKQSPLNENLFRDEILSSSWLYSLKTLGEKGGQANFKRVGMSDSTFRKRSDK